MKIRTTVLLLLVFLAGAACGSRLLPRPSEQPRRTAKTTDLKRIDLGSWCEGKEATVQLLEVGPGTSDKHFHPAHSFAYVLEGTEAQLVSGRAPLTVGVGEVLYDGPGEVHETTNSAPAKIIVFRIIEKGKEATTFVP